MILTIPHARRNDEAELQKAVWQHILLKGNPKAIAFAVPNEGLRSKRSGARLKAMGLVAGVFDIALILPDGRYAALELKTTTGRLSPAQKAYAARLDAMGVPYLISSNLDEIILTLQMWGVLK